MQGFILDTQTIFFLIKVSDRKINNCLDAEIIYSRGKLLQVRTQIGIILIWISSLF